MTIWNGRRTSGTPSAVTERPGASVKGRSSRSVAQRRHTGIRRADDYALLVLDDPRVRIVGLTVPEPGRVLVRLQSFAEEHITCRLTPGFPVTAAMSADYLGTVGAALRAGEDGSLPVPVPRLGTMAVSLTTGSEPDRD
ncbi:hypothetical protein ABT001_35320 [Streptomyces sp. NPDC002793]|uniref:hypothetical protein n=1 Tax=Streptomyces sp. NPDC002793 TaxID=3154432 RepID=UPI00332BEBC1